MVDAGFDDGHDGLPGLIRVEMLSEDGLPIAWKSICYGIETKETSGDGIMASFKKFAWDARAEV